MGIQRVVRHATRHDLAALERLEKAAFPADAFSRAQLRYLLTQANATTYVADESGKVIGSAIMLWRQRSTLGRLYSIATDPDCQGRGIGGQLLEACESDATRRGCHELRLEVRADNQQAITFYIKRGYQVIEELPDFYADGTTGIRMGKSLPA